MLFLVNKLQPFYLCGDNNVDKIRTVKNMKKLLLFTLLLIGGRLLSYGQSNNIPMQIVNNGGALLEAKIEMVSGGTLILTNNGTINRASNSALVAPYGSNVFYYSGTIN